MGRYYKIAFKNEGTNGKVVTNDRKYTGSEYVMAKLMEHSYIGNFLLDSVANAIYKTPTKLLWCGDYAESDEVTATTKGETSYDAIWGNEADNSHEFPVCKEFAYAGKFLVNHDTKEFISFDKYLKRAKEAGGEDLIINPISLLTVLGNGRGGGDYEGTDMDSVGTWAWNVISIEDAAPEGGVEVQPFFKESW